MRGAPAWAVLVLGGITIASGRLFGLVELYIIGTALVLGVLAALIHVRARTVAMALIRDVEPLYPISGSDITVALTVQSLRRTPTCELIDVVDDIGRVGLTLTPLAKHRTARVRYRVPTHSRGILTLGPATVELSDPLGLLSRRHQIGTTTSVVVHPQWSPIDLPDPQHCEGTLLDLIRRLIDQMSVNLEFRSLREYVAGDDLRRINWKASARRDVLTLNEYEARAPLIIQVLLDNDESTYSPAGFERAVSVAASFVGSALASGRDSEPRVHLSCPPHFDTVINESTRLDAMKCLAVINCDTEILPCTPLNDPTEFRVNVIICGDRDSKWLNSVDRSMGVGHVSVVVFCETPTGSGFDHDHWFSLLCLDFKDFAAQWATLSRPQASQ